VKCLFLYFYRSRNSEKKRHLSSSLLVELCLGIFEFCKQKIHQNQNTSSAQGFDFELVVVSLLAYHSAKMSLESPALAQRVPLMKVLNLFGLNDHEAKWANSSVLLKNLDFLEDTGQLCSQMEGVGFLQRISSATDDLPPFCLPPTAGGTADIVYCFETEKKERILATIQCKYVKGIVRDPFFTTMVENWYQYAKDNSISLNQVLSIKPDPFPYRIECVVQFPGFIKVPPSEVSRIRVGVAGETFMKLLLGQEAMIDAEDFLANLIKYKLL